MVVDDEPSIVGFMTLLLEGAGCKVIGVTSAAEALRIFQNNPYCVDMVITDQSMPELTGVELARNMLVSRPDLPVVISTGYNEGIESNLNQLTGIRRVLNKPVAGKVLIDLVAEFLVGKDTFSSK